MRQRPADRDRLPHGQGLAVRHRGPRLARRRPQALLRRLLPRARPSSSARTACALPTLRGLGPPLRDGPGRRRRHGGSASGTRSCCCARRSRTTAATAEAMAARLDAARAAARRRAAATPRAGAPRVEAVYELAARRRRTSRPSCALKPGTRHHAARRARARAPATTTRPRGGALLVGARPTCSARPGQQRRRRASPRASGTRRRTRTRARSSIGGICEDAMAGILSGLATFGRHIGVGLVLRRLHRAARPHRGAAARDRRPGAARPHGARVARSSSSAPTRGSRPARTGRPTPTRSRCSSCRRTSRAGR